MFVIKFQGGFANQIFQYSLYLKLKEDYPSQKIYVDLSHYKNCKDHGGFKLNHFVKLNKYKKIKFSKFIHIDEKNYKQMILNIKKDKNYLFEGYWQSKIFFPRDLSKTLKIFGKSNLKNRNLCFLDQIEYSNSISIHIRRGDYVNNFLHGNIANKCYFQNSIDFIRTKFSNSVFFVFSDDISWARQNLCFYDSKVIYIHGNEESVEQDLILMSCCKHNIISNSSFSWWAQNINSNLEKLVITPEYWFNQETNEGIELSVENSIKIANTSSFLKRIKEPFFSILIPVYNTSKTLRRTLESVLNQTFSNIEVIIVDDGSEDNSWEVLQSYEERDKRITLLRHENNKGLLSARITAMRAVQGKYVLFLDSDDWYSENACQILYNELINRDIDILEFGYIQEPEKSKHMTLTRQFENRVECLMEKRYPITIWNKAYSNALINKALPFIDDFHCTLGEDGYFSIIFAFFANTIEYTENYIHHYMLYTGISTQKNYSLEQVSTMIEDLSSIEQYLRKFFLKKDTNFLPFIDEFIFQRYLFVYYVTQGSVECNKIFLLLSRVNNKKFENFMEKEIVRLRNNNDFFSMDLKSLFKFLVKYFLRKLGLY